MSKNNLHTKKELRAFRKELRENLTPSEAFLWKHLKAKQFMGKRFTRQHSIGPYIVDFYCASEWLIIELDGEVHNNAAAQEYDEKRTQFLEGLDYQVIRFENKMVFENLTMVLNAIASHFKSEPSV